MLSSYIDSSARFGKQLVTRPDASLVTRPDASFEWKFVWNGTLGLACEIRCVEFASWRFLMSNHVDVDERTTKSVVTIKSAQGESLEITVNARGANQTFVFCQQVQQLSRNAEADNGLLRTPQAAIRVETYAAESESSW